VCTLVPTNQRCRRTWQFMKALLLKKWKPLSCQLQVKVKVNAGSHELGALRVTSEGKGKCWVPWTRRAQKHLALLVGHLTLPGIYDVSWRELVRLRGNNSNYWSPATPPHLQLNNRSISAFWMVLSGEATGSPFPQTQNTLPTGENNLFLNNFSLSVLLSLPGSYLPIVSHHFSCHMTQSHLTTYHLK